MQTASQTSRLTLGTAKITPQLNGGFVLTYMGIGSWTVGERDYGCEADARQFCADRGLRVL